MNKDPIEMQKGKNAIKNIVLVLILTIAYQAFSQIEKLNGTYSNLASLQEHYNYYVFDHNGKFDFHTGASLGDDYFGKGTYKTIENLLILDHNKTEPIEIAHHVSKIWINNLSTIDIHFRFFDFNSTPLPFVNVIYKDSLSKNGYNGIVANKAGEAELTLTKENKELNLVISNLGHSQYKFTLDKKYNYDISVYLQKEGVGLPIRNQIDTLEIIEHKPKYFIVKNKDGSIITWRKRED